MRGFFVYEMCGPMSKTNTPECSNDVVWPPWYAFISYMTGVSPSAASRWTAPHAPIPVPRTATRVTYPFLSTGVSSRRNPAFVAGELLASQHADIVSARPRTIPLDDPVE